VAAALACVALAQTSAADPSLSEWPRVASAIAPDAAMESRIKAIVAGMSVAQKVGQMIQPDISAATPDDVRRYYLGGILNGADSQPFGARFATFEQWREATRLYHAAALATDMPVKIPLIWGTDAVHGHGIVRGASIFPHNIGLGAAHDAELVGEIGAVVGAQVRATGIDWVFAPTLAVVQNYRWGRSYESYSSDPSLVREYAASFVSALQGTFAGPANAVATAKHFIGDGGTGRGVDRGVNLSSRRQMIGIHAQGYVGALGAGVQTVMASYNSWNDRQGGHDYGKMHGARTLLTDVLKDRMGFDGFIVSDWNGIGEVAGCSVANCARAINSGIDMLMVPEQWKSFIANTIEQVNDGEIPLARIDDAVTRILRVKMRAGLFDRRPDQFYGDESTLLARPLARRAVRESLVLLKNIGRTLPLAQNKKILVVGRSADSLRNQAGGWSLDWQGAKNTNADFPAGDTILAGIREAAGNANVVYSEDAAAVTPADFDVIIAVLGEGPYAEMKGDIIAPGLLSLTSQHPEDRAVLDRVAGYGKPVVTVLVSGRPLYVSDLINRSDAFVAAWLPGTEGKGIADVLFADARGQSRYDFRGTLPFAWPRSPCQDSFEGHARPLFERGYGLRYAHPKRLAVIQTPPVGEACTSHPSARTYQAQKVSPLT
jgi:beta-glucosidase